MDSGTFGPLRKPSELPLKVKSSSPSAVDGSAERKPRMLALDSLWQIIIGAGAAIAGGLTSGVLAVWWQARRAEDLARRLRRADREEEALLALNARPAGIREKVDAAYRTAPVGRSSPIPSGLPLSLRVHRAAAAPLAFIGLGARVRPQRTVRRVHCAIEGPPLRPDPQRSPSDVLAN
jgi:hypothetical protein